jgi:benzoyl-CoA 2,3-dioxygenase component B
MLIPNNVGLSDGQLITKQLQSYQQTFSQWWKKCGPQEFLDRPMNLRSPTGSTVGGGWSQNKMMRPDEYRWGIFTKPREQQQIEFGQHRGEKLWDTVPDDYYYLLLDHITVQADVENGSIEQSRLLTQTAPSAFDLQNLYQFLLEEGRHSWAMVHVLLEHFGEDGLVESESLLERMCGDSTAPRLLNAFNHTTDDWLSHFMWCFLADRNGKYQLDAVTTGAFNPLADSCRFMLLEEPLHIKMGSHGLERVLTRSVQLILQHDTEEIFAFGGIPLKVIQQYFNLWFSRVLDLFGHDESSRSYEMYQIGIRAPRNFANIQKTEIEIDTVNYGKVSRTGVDPQNAINAVMRRQFIAEVAKTVDHWNISLKQLNVEFELKIPDERFNREIGPCSGLPFGPNGELISGDTEAAMADYFPKAKSLLQVKGLMKRVLADNECASWISLPSFGLLQLVQSRAAA